MRIKTGVCIVGSGPVGLTASLLLAQFGIKNIVLQKRKSLRSHPSAHLLNMRSMEILSQIPSLSQQLYSKAQSLTNYQYFRYVRHVYGNPAQEIFGQTNHFFPSIQEKINQLKKYSDYHPIHLQQPQFLNILHQRILKPPLNQLCKILFQYQPKSIRIQNENVVIKTNNQQIECQYLLAADGYNSFIRKLINIQMQGDQKLMTLGSIHFRSKQLANKIIQDKMSSMLHFIYNKNIIGTLVSHSYKQGQFVLHIPNYEPIYDVLQEKCQSLVHKICNRQITDLKIIQKGKWQVNASYAKKFSLYRIFLLGDSCHGFPPAGGFGMNMGIQDADNIAHKIRIRQSSKQQSILQQYRIQRERITKYFMNIAKKLYQVSIKNARHMYLEHSLINLIKTGNSIFEKTYLYPHVRSLLRKSIQYGHSLTQLSNLQNTKLQLAKKQNTIPLIFQEEEFNQECQISYLSRNKEQRNKLKKLSENKINFVIEGKKQKIFQKYKFVINNYHEQNKEGKQRLLRTDGFIYK